MSTPDNKPKGPWGKPENVAAMDALEKAEREAGELKKEEIARVSKNLKERVLKGDEEALGAFEEALFPATKTKLRALGAQLDGLLMDVLLLTGEKYGWSVVNKMLSHGDIRPLADEYRDELRKKARGWQK